MRTWCGDDARRADSAHAEADADAADFTNFDGNCQTFRLLTRLHVLNDNFGLNLTCATLATLMKYPVFSRCRRDFKKFGLFETERDAANDVWKETGLDEGVRHPLAYVMEACDDIAYSVIDAQDTVKKRFASFNDLIDFLSDSDDPVTKCVLKASQDKNREYRKESLSPNELDDLSMQMFSVKAIAEMVEAATCTFVSSVECIMGTKVDPEFDIVGRSDAEDLCCRLKKFDRVNGFRHPDVLRSELRGHNYIMQTMDWFWQSLNSEGRFEDYVRSRISENYRRVYEDTNKSKSDKLHLVCDTVSG